MRTLLSKVELYDDEEEGEHAADWWELFVDLIIVAACSKVADGYKEAIEDGTATYADGLLAFVVTFSLFQTGWHFYVFFNTRFKDASLLHSFLLFVYMLGTAGMVASASGFESAADMAKFSTFMIIQRIPVLIMFFLAATHIARARRHAAAMCVVLVLSCVMASMAALLPETDHKKWIWIVMAVFEHLYVLGLLKVLNREDFVPVDVDHSNEREGCMVMVVLGESVVTAVGVKPTAGTETAFYYAMLLTLALAFNFGLNYYHVAPPKELHAFGKGPKSAISFVLSQNLLTMSLLCVGTGLKLAMSAVVEDEPMEAGHIWVLFSSLSMAMLAILFVRMLHFFGHHPTPYDSGRVRALKWFWWGVSFTQWVPPLVAAAVLTADGDCAPNVAIAWGLACIFYITVAESIISHVLHTWGAAEMEINGHAEVNNYATFKDDA